jgi:hypothetical protein
MRTSDGTALRMAGSLPHLSDRNAILDLKRYAEDITVRAITSAVLSQRMSLPKNGSEPA